MTKKIILGITGKIASGKTTVAKYIVKKYNGNSHRFSTVLRDVADRMHLEKNRKNLQKISTIFKQNFNEDILSKVIFHDVDNDKHKIIVIDGVRRLSDVAYLKKLNGFKLIYIKTDIKKSYERILTRGENSDDINKTFKDFQKDHKREAEIKIKNLKKDANIIIDNNGNLDELYSQIDEIINKS